VRLAAGESVAVRMAITPAELAFHDVQMRYLVEPGEFSIMVGTSSRDADLQTVTLRVEP
jgi:beta-glucosidase